MWNHVHGYSFTMSNLADAVSGVPFLHPQAQKERWSSCQCVQKTSIKHSFSPSYSDCWHKSLLLNNCTSANKIGESLCWQAWVWRLQGNLLFHSPVIFPNVEGRFHSSAPLVCMCVMCAEGSAAVLLARYPCVYNKRAVKGSCIWPGGVSN